MAGADPGRPLGTDREERVLHRIVGLILGGVVIWVILTVGEAIGSDSQPRYLVAIVIGLLVALVYPWIIGLSLMRRDRMREQARQQEIQAEVDRRVAEERARQDPS
jgi:lipopolysaccharide export LptBFGC system permease protein LptF